MPVKRFFLLTIILFSAFLPLPAGEIPSKKEEPLPPPQTPQPLQPADKERLYFGSKGEIRTRLVSVDFDYLTMGLKKIKLHVNLPPCRL